MAIRRTTEQEAAVKDRGGGLLVAAAAGSGKTRVLVDRLLDRVVGEGHDVDEFLIITFTQAAAEELRGRIAASLADAQAADPTDAHLRRQSTRLYQTQISTIHAFCTVLLRQWGHLLDVPTDFSLCEDEETTVLMGRTLDQVLEERYEDVDPEGPFARLLDLLTAGRDDSRLMEIVLDVYARVQSWPDPAAWLEEQRAQFALAGVTDAGETPWGRVLLDDVRGTARYWAGQLRRACDLAAGDAVLEKAYGASLLATAEGLDRLASAGGWDEAVGCEVPFSRFKAARGVSDTAAQDQIKSLRGRCKKAIETAQGRLSGRSAALLADMALVRPAMDGLIDLVLDFSRRYEAEKRRRDLLDFSDLEHLTVRLLIGPDGAPTDLARQLRGRWCEIMVDEYQDTNQVQNAIFRALSDEGRDLFFVGDVKQSIYRFRLADPTIFLARYRTSPLWTEAAPGQDRKIVLSQNFRSRPEVLESVNDLFRCIMSQELGEMDYTDAEALYPGGSFPPGDGYETELHVLDLDRDDADDLGGRALAEARFVAKRLRALLDEGFPVSDGAGGTRPLRPEDVAILLRSPGPVQHWYTMALAEQQIGCAATEGDDFFRTTEVSVALSWLQILDDARQDVPLLAVLRSAVFGFTPDRLAEIRALDDGSFYDALRRAQALGWPDCAAFLDRLDALRFGAGEQSSHQLLWTLYREEGLLDLFSALPNGEERRANLLALYDLARRFEGTGHKGLFGFLLHLDRVRRNGGIRPAPPPAQEGGGVALLSIHRSKGLEYPVVFVSGLGRRFNYADVQKPVLFHPRLGLGPRGLDRARQVQFTTLAREGVALELKREMMAEEMRLLYVAMTRAKEKLILTHSLSYGASDLRALAEAVAVPAEPQALAACASVGQWVLLAAMGRPEGKVLLDAADVPAPVLPPRPLGPAWTIRYHTGAVSQEVVRPARRAADAPEESGPTDEEVLADLRWRYPYETAAATPAKVTATQVQTAPGEEPGVFVLRRGAEEAGPPAFERPVFAQETMGLTAAQRGTALHTAMQTIDLARTGSVETIRAELARLTAQGHLTERQAAAVDAAAMARFFASPLGQAMRASGDRHREWPFSLLADARRFFPDAPEGEEVLVQGVIDCWFDGPEGLTVLDFKTDRVPPSGLAERAARYRGQLDTYAWALERIVGRPVARRVLWFLHAGEGVAL